jgi:predicted ATP-binding protein involved in virulence
MKMNDNAKTLLNPRRILTVRKKDIEYRKLVKEHIFKDDEYELDFISYCLFIHYPTKDFDLRYKTDQERQIDYERLEGVMENRAATT